MTPERLAATDVAPGPLDQLRSSAVREVVVLGRRGPAESAFTVPELIGLSGLEDIDVLVETDPGSSGGPDQRSRLLAEIASRPPSSDPTRRRIVLRFAASPVEILGEDGRVTGVRPVRNEVLTGPDGRVHARATGEESTLDAGLVIRSIGHRGQPVPGLPFDSATSTVQHDAGRVEPGLYVVGWIKRGPVGFIGTNKTCARGDRQQPAGRPRRGTTRPGSRAGVDERVRAAAPARRHRTRRLAAARGGGAGPGRPGRPATAQGHRPRGAGTSVATPRLSSTARQGADVTPVRSEASAGDGRQSAGAATTRSDASWCSRLRCRSSTSRARVKRSGSPRSPTAPASTARPSTATSRTEPTRRSPSSARSVRASAARCWAPSPSTGLRARSRTGSSPPTRSGP
ncbi:hypothetical protein [Nocardioides sp. B-3]|uniref:hypothetical protein n=1 Tax=Nocardioides sp. B-3 TaxID=2895565 RepID=UPI0021520CB6|nr:hypothetical protein [Nocardioides sp. B-3]UUZ59194.1 hypothetical protein LP418_25305 [Nocardioides sp. B-3]